MNKYFLLFLCLCPFALFGQDQLAKQWAIYENKGQDSLLPEADKGGSSSVLVKFNSPITKHSLQKKDIKILRILDRSHYILSLPNILNPSFAKEHTVSFSNTLWKLSNALVTRSSPKKNTYVIQSSNIEKTVLALRSRKKVKILSQTNDYLYIYGRLKWIKKNLLPLEEIRYIGQESLTPTQESIVRDLNPAINNINNIYKEYPDLKGEGIIVSVKDNSFITNDIDLRDKLVDSPLLSDTVDDHATDMSTIIAGLGNSSIKGKGVAPRAKIQSSDFSNLSPDPKTYLSEANIFIQNHSYGTTVENFYGSLAESYDGHIHENPKELHIFSSGNAGEVVPDNGIYSGVGSYANLTGNFKMSKNSLTVGAMNEEKSVIPFSSKGPAHDGRIKPELVAYGIVGTSNAAAITSGLTGLLQESYINGFGENPSASLLKSVLINSADDIGPLGPDYASGFGNINGYRALKTIQENRFIIDKIRPNEVKIFSITVPENTRNLKLSLVWTDVPATVNSNLALVNDIDMLVFDHENTPNMPWILDATAELANLESLAQTGEDHINNIEQVLIGDPVPGQVDIHITGFDITTDDQEFSIAYGWEKDGDFKWNYPLTNNNFPYDGETATYIRWENNIEAEEGTLSVSYDNASTWETIVEATSLSNGYFLWFPPENMNSSAVLKMSINGSEFLSDAFVISNAITLSVGLDCEDSLQLTWNKQEGAKNYNIYNLKDNMMQITATTVDTTFVFSKNTIDSNYFSVQAVLNNDAVGIRGNTIDYQTFDAGCYVNFLIAEASEDKKASQLSISLSSLFNVERIEIEKKIGGVFETIGAIETLDNLRPMYLDKEPIQGLNTYRIKTILKDGTTFFSEESELFLLTTLPFTIFPSLVEDGITVLTKDFMNAKVWLEVYSLDGKMVMAQEINENQEFIFLDGLTQGIYALSLYSSTGEKFSELIYKL